MTIKIPTTINTKLIAELKVPAKYLSERTARLADLDWDQEEQA